MIPGGAFLTSPIGEKPVFSPENFSEEQKEFAQAAEEFARSEIYSHKDQIETLDEGLTRRLIRMCGELGFLGIDIPEAYGGLGQPKATAALVTEKLAYGQSESFMVTYSVQTGIGILPIVYFGTDSQKELYLPKLVSGEWISAYALTEPGSGSDALSIRTTARFSEAENVYILNGQKQFISNGSWANVLITFAKIDGEKLTGFLIDPRTDGVVIHEEKNKLGLHGSSTANIILENVRVPKENVLGSIGKGAEIAFNTLDIGRFKLGAAVLGGSKNTISASVNYALERRQFGQPIAYFEAIKKKIADMTLRSFALESIVYETAGCLDQSIAEVNPDSPTYPAEVANAIEKYAMECSICKVHGSETLWQNSDDGLQIFGGYGFIEDYPLARIMRDTRVDRLYEGTNEINRQIILGYLLKKTLLEEVPIREKIKEIPHLLKGQVSLPKHDILSRETAALEWGKFLLLYVVNQALIQYGQDIQQKQQIGEWISDMIIHLFVVNTVLSRILQHGKNSDIGEELLAAGAVITAESMLELTKLAHLSLCSLLKNKPLKKALSDLQKFRQQMTLDTDISELKNKIADLVYKQKQYPF
ncbi:MAG: acyl-CoA dehydrogenase FadE [Calditrichia bacterium]